MRTSFPIRGLTHPNVLSIASFCRSGAHTVQSQVMDSFYMCVHTINQSDVCKERLRALTILELALAPPCTEEDICWQLSRCRSGKAPGPDGIQARMLKLCAMELLSVQWSSLLQKTNKTNIHCQYQPHTFQLTENTPNSLPSRCWTTTGSTLFNF